MVEHTAPLPAGTILDRVRDAEWRGAQTGMPRPMLSHTDDACTTLTWVYPDGTNIDPSVVTAWRNAVVANTPTAPWRVQETIESQLAAAMAVLQTIIDTPQPNIANAAQAQTAVRALQAQVKDEARILRRMLRLLHGQLDGTD